MIARAKFAEDRALTRATYVGYDVVTATGCRRDAPAVTVRSRYELTQLKVQSLRQRDVAPRGFTADGVDLLVAIFRTVGYAACSPIIWRPSSSDPTTGRAVYGAKQLYAAWLAGLETIPAFVKL